MDHGQVWGDMENTNTNTGSVATAEPEAPNRDIALRSLALAVSLHLRGSQEDALKELDRAEHRRARSTCRRFMRRGVTLIPSWAVSMPRR